VTQGAPESAERATTARLGCCDVTSHLALTALLTDEPGTRFRWRLYPESLDDHRARAHALLSLPKSLRDWPRAVENALSPVRAWVEHPFHVIETLFRHRKLGYRDRQLREAPLDRSPTRMALSPRHGRPRGCLTGRSRRWRGKSAHSEQKVMTSAPICANL
jgi:hypothetical protein